MMKMMMNTSFVSPVTTPDDHSTTTTFVPTKTSITGSPSTSTVTTTSTGSDVSSIRGTSSSNSSSNRKSTAIHNRNRTSSTFPIDQKTSPTTTASRKLILPERHIWHLRTLQRERIREWYHHNQQQQQQPPSSSNQTLNSATTTTTTNLKDGVVDVVNPSEHCITRTPSSTTRNLSLSSSILLHDTHSSTSATTGLTQRQRVVVPTFLIVTGPTGSGKTTLMQSVLQELVMVVPSTPPPAAAAALQQQQHSHYFIRGAFDRMQHPDPYRAYILALTDFTSQFLARGLESSTQAVAMRQAIRDTCGDDIQVLIQMIPTLSAMMVHDTDHHDNGSHTAATAATAATGDDEVNGSSGKNAASIPSSPQTRPPVQQVDATQRFIFVLQNFLRAICSVVPSIVLVLEDMQYADNCSIDVLCSILTDLHQIPGLLVAATYNGTDWWNEASAVSVVDRAPTNKDPAATSSTTTTTTSTYFVEQIRKMDSSCHTDGSIHIQTISIENFKEEQVQYLLTQTLQQCSLFDLQVDDNFCTLVMEHTSGNLYHIIEFLHWLEDQQLLTTNSPANGSSNNRYTYWTWNMDEIYRAVNNKMLPPTEDPSSNRHQHFYSSNMLDKVPRDMIEILKVGACLGNSRIDEMMIESVLGYSIQNSVTEAVQMGILIHLHDGKENKLYAFAHENVQQIVYHLIPENDREMFHLEIGRRLWRRLEQKELDRNVFVVLSQIRLGWRLITRSSERYKTAALCLHAGQKAAKSSSFRTSLIYLRFGIELLGDNGWREEYDLTLMLYNATAEMEVCNANYESMELLVSKILQHSRCSDDTIPARTTHVYALCVSDRQHEGLDRGIQLVADLGFAFPAHFSLWTLRSELKAVLSLLKGKSDDYLKSLPFIEDATILTTMHVLNMVSWECFERIAYSG